MLKRENVFLSTIDPEAGALARRYGVGLEIAEYCTAWNMDRCFSETDQTVRETCRGISRRMFHGPFNELFPCAIDPLARELAARRFDQALDLSRSYRASGLILHGGFQPYLYFPCWYEEQSVLFWKSFLQEHPGDYRIFLENVLEPEPEMLLSVVRQVDDPRLGLCLDTGHVNAYSRVPVMEWIDCWGSRLSHAHIHNNDGSADTHSGPEEGTLPMKQILSVLTGATVTLELPRIGNALDWMLRNDLLDG